MRWKWRRNIELSKEDIDILLETREAMKLYKEYYSYDGKITPFVELVDRLANDFKEVSNEEK